MSPLNDQDDLTKPLSAPNKSKFPRVEKWRLEIPVGYPASVPRSLRINSSQETPSGYNYITDEEQERSDAFDEERRQDRRPNESVRMPRSREAAFVVQDRSKSKSARLKAEARRKSRRSIEILEPLSSSRKRRADDDDVPHKKRRHLLDVSDHYVHDNRSRGRIVISSVGSGPGIISKGVSSGQCLGYDKRLHNQTGQEMAQSSAARSKLEAKVKASKASVSTSSDENRRASSRLHLYDEEEKALRQRLHQVRKLKEAAKKAAMQKQEDAAEESSVTVENPWDTASDSHSAYSVAQRAKVKRRAEAISAQKPVEAPARIRERRSPVNEAPPASSPAPPNEPPPLLAFDGNRPHQHPNAWRGQHSRHEPDWREKRETLDAAGGPLMPSARPLDYLIDDLGRAGPPRDMSWEVLPGDFTEEAVPRAAFYDNDCARHWGMQGQHDVRQEQQVPHYEHIGQENQEVDLHDDWHDGIDTFAEYFNYNESPADIDFDRDNAASVEYAMFDQDAYQEQDKWLDEETYHHQDRWPDEETYMDQIDPEQTIPAPVYDLRAAVQPTSADMVDFWKPQPLY